MTTPLSIWRENRATFGGGARNWSRRDVALYYLGIAGLASALAIATSRPSDNMFNAVLTAVSIIAGFTFNALLFLVQGKFNVITDPTLLEQKARQRKVDRLAKASFSVIYYFNVMSVIVVAASVIALLGPSIGTKAPKSLLSVFDVIETMSRALFFSFLIETGVTFYRALRRLRYLFNKVRDVAAE